MLSFEPNFLGLNTTNFDNMLHFYTKVMKLTVKHSKPGWAAFQTTSVKLELFSADKIDEPTTTQNPNQAPLFIGFETKNIQEALEWVKSNNINIIEDLATHNWGTDFYFNDPDGNIIQIAQYT